MGGRLEVRFASFGDHSLVRPCLGRLGLDSRDRSEKECLINAPESGSSSNSPTIFEALFNRLSQKTKPGIIN